MEGPPTLAQHKLRIRAEIERAEIELESAVAYVRSMRPHDSIIMGYAAHAEEREVRSRLKALYALL
jgi:hypothetical protein